jgi:hypothetical protein
MGAGSVAVTGTPDDVVWALPARIAFQAPDATPNVAVLDSCFKL